MDQALLTQLMKCGHKQLLRQHLTHKSIKGHLNIDFFLEEFKQEGSGMKDIRSLGWRKSQSMGGYCRPTNGPPKAAHILVSSTLNMSPYVAQRQ